MTPEQWRQFKRAARMEAGPAPLALIVDSPWIPGLIGAGQLDYYLEPDLWFRANLALEREFPRVTMFPSWWVEYGMAIEPSAFGSRIHFYPDQPPAQSPVLRSIAEAGSLKVPNPLADGLMPLALQLYRRHRPRIRDAGSIVPVVAARGPLCTAGFLRGIQELLMDTVEEPAAVHNLLAVTTQTCIDWLSAQADAVGETVEGILVLDDIPGMLSLKAYREFAHPYLKRICDAFPKQWIKVYHNDANVRPFLAELPDIGFDVLNWTHRIDVADARAKTGGRLCLMGNLAPLEIGARGTPEQVNAAARALLAKMPDGGLILSLGGGASPGMPRQNVAALESALDNAISLPSRASQQGVI